MEEGRQLGEAVTSLLFEVGRDDSPSPVGHGSAHMEEHTLGGDVKWQF